MRLPSCLVLAVVALAAGVTPSLAQRSTAYACSYPKLGIPTCTRLIEGGTLKGEALAKIYSQRALQFEELGELDRAIADYSEAIRHDPDTTLAINNRAILLRKKGDYGASLDDWKRLGVLDTSSKGWLLGRAQVYVEMGEYLRAIHDYSQAMDAHPFEARWQRAYAYHRAGEHELALTELSEVMRHAADFAPMLYAVRSVIHCGMGARDRAAADLREAHAAEAARRRKWPDSGPPDPGTQEWLDRAQQKLAGR